MKIVKVRHIDGPNIYIYKPIMVARIDLEDLTERESYEVPGFADRLLRTLPGLREHHCAKGAPGGFVERLYGGTYFGHIVEHAAIELACCAGIDVHFGKTLYAGENQLYDIVMECRSYKAQKHLLQAAVELVQLVVHGSLPRIDDYLAEAAAIMAKSELGPSTQAIVDAARRRDIPVRRLTEGSLIQLGYGSRRKLVEATVTEHTSAVAVDIAGDKSITKQLLQDIGITVPDGVLANSAQEAVEAFQQMGTSVVVKPFNGNQGRGVSLDLKSAAEVMEAYAVASQYASTVLVEQYVHGRNLRVLVVNGKYTAASERVPAHVVGDGAHTIEELIYATNQHPARGRGHEKPLTQITVDSVVLHTLRKQNWTLSSVPPVGQTVMLRESANLSTGGEAIDITDDLHESYRALAQRVARNVGLDVCGIDMVVQNIHLPAEIAGYAIIEVNAAPGIRMHQFPSMGKARDVADSIVSSLFPNGDTGRIPIVAITGTNGKTTTTRLIGHALQQTGKCVGMTTTSGVFIGGQKVLDGDTTGPTSARLILADPSVDVAVLETARGGIVRGGLAYDKANVAVMTNISLDHVGQDGIESIEDLVHVKSLVAECVWEDGTVVLNADDSELLKLSARLKPKVAFFSTSDQNPAVARHLALGGVAYFVSNGWLVEGRGSLTWEIVPVAEIPLTMNGTASFQVENCLAALATLRAFGMTRQQAASALVSFAPNRDNVGRCMIYHMPSGGHVVLDYGHNPDGFKKIGDWLQSTPHKRLIGVVGVPGDRPNPLIRRSAEQLAQIFDGFVVKEDADKRGRNPGEVAHLMADQIQSVSPAKPCMIVLDEQEALRSAICSLESGDIAVMFYEKLAPLIDVVRDYGGVPTSTIHVSSPTYAAQY